MIKMNGKPLVFNHFNDGSFRADINLPEPREGEVTITWLYHSDIEFMYLNYVIQHLRSHFYYDITLELPYVPNCRQDRVKRKEEVFTLKYSCDFINTMSFDRVKIFDPHSSVTPALLNRVIVQYPEAPLRVLATKYPEAVFFMPDEGAMKRYRNYINSFYSFGIKERNYETQAIESLRIAGATHMIPGHDIIIVDDILSRGSTLYAAAKRLKEQGANKIYVWVSHCENTVLQPHLNGQSLVDIPNLIEKIYTTNSIYTGKHPKIEVIYKF